MSAKSIEYKTADNRDTWIRVIKKGKRNINTSSKVHIGNVQSDGEPGALIDGGTNTGLQGSDMRMIYQEQGTVSVIGPSGSDINMEDLALVTCGGVAITSTNEKVLVIVTSAASYGKGKSILSRF